MTYNFQGVLFIKPALCGLITSIFIMAAQGAENATEKMVDDHTLLPTDRVEFAFVLLPDASVSQAISDVAIDVAHKLRPLDSLPLNPVWGNYSNEVVKLPHVSIGQYGILRMEYTTLKEIVDQTAQKFKSFKEPMAKGLSVTTENVFLDFQHVRESTNHIIIDMYVELRGQFMTRMATKFPITQALLQRLENKNNPDELFYIDKCYQNWGTPEQHRIRPHFTLLYNYAASETAVRSALSGINLPSSLGTITFSRLGVVQIDAWGNPKKLLYEINLSD